MAVGGIGDVYNGAAMRGILRASLALVLPVCAAGAAAAPPRAGDLPAPGARGVCVTEMDGGERVEIPVTVLGTLAPATPEGEIVLVRLDDPRFERTGIIAGMSGSPVYVEGRLVGALAYGWPFEREPIGGVTPWARMEALGGGPPAAVGGARPSFATLTGAWSGPEPGKALLDWLLPEPPGGLTRLPLAVAGGPAPAVAWLGEAWERLGWAGGAAAAGPEPVAASGPLRPGDMIAAVLLSGDATLAAGGTVTQVRDGTVWAFGHPFLGAGGLELPLARARVLAVLPSVMSSFKFFAVGDEIGLVTQDRARGIRGRLGPRAATVPIVVTEAGRTYRFRAPEHPVLLPLLAAYVTAASHAAHGRTFGEMTLACRLRVRYDDGREGRIEAVFPATDAPARASAMVGAVVGYLMATPFPAPRLAGLSVHLEAAEGTAVARLAGVWPDRQRVRPGEELLVRVRLEPRGDAPVTRAIRVRVPEGLAGRRVDLIVADGASWTEYDLEQRPLVPARFRDELRLLARYLPADRLVVALEAEGDAAAIPGGTVAAPPSQLLLWRRTRGSAAGAVRRLVVARAEAAFPWAIQGAVRIPLEIAGDGGWGGTAGGRDTARGERR